MYRKEEEKNIKMRGKEGKKVWKGRERRKQENMKKRR